MSFGGVTMGALPKSLVVVARDERKVSSFYEVFDQDLSLWITMGAAIDAERPALVADLDNAEGKRERERIS